tara:strand:+ start:148 stop:603 length:456 start_codon:yes stop_codon:yes gene_type:complete
MFLTNGKMGVIMASIPMAELQALSKMDDYDKMLAMDRVSRQYGVSVANIEKQLSALSSGGIVQEMPANDDLFVPSKTSTEPSTQLSGAPTYLDNANKFRMKYDPSEESVSKQSQVNQAILCPHCSVPLGIPATRPIKVMCPSCMQESTFYN